MFDSVMIQCPRCLGTMEAQSKAGPCHLATLSSTDVPAEIAVDLEGEHVYCESCSISWVIQLATRAIYSLTVSHPDGFCATADEEVELLEKRLAAAKARQQREAG